MREPPRSPDARIDALALALAPQVGPRTYFERVEAWGSAAHAFASTVDRREQNRLREVARRAADEGVRVGARLLLLEDADYPEPARHLHDPPPFLFILGDLGVLARPTVAIVGTRRATPYGERVTAAIASALAEAGATIVSGMARGIDGVAHRATLASRGATVAVLGTGVDIAYPAAHRALHRSIRERGLLISEFPCGARAQPGSFPRRNRVIAALARVTIVVEGGERSGARLTANYALELGRDVGAVPGPIDAPQSALTNELLRDGAHIMLGAEDALLLAGLPVRSRKAHTPELHGDEALVWAALADGMIAVDLLPERASLPPNRALAAVTSLEVAGLVETTLSGELRQREP